MITTYFRSSSFSDYLDYCQQKYYISYILGHQDAANKKAEMGTVVHKVLEVLALCKLALQNNEDKIIDDVLGELSFSQDDLYKKSIIPSKSIAKINKDRSYASKYSWDCTIQNNHERMGVDFVEYILESAYNFYSSRSAHAWTNADKNDCLNWTWIPLDYHNGIYDPRLRNIYAPEKRFDITLENDWAAYDFELDGKKYTGQLAMKGTIDLIFKVDDNLLEVCDWKGLPIDTPIPTIGGWKTMGDLKINDVVFDQEGRQTKVIGKSEASLKPCFKLTFDDTTTVECDNEHLWKIADGSVVPVTQLCTGNKITLPSKLNCSNDVWKILDNNQRFYGKESDRTIIYIDKSEDKITQCIMVDSPSNTYLCTKNMIPTHNTGQRKNWGTGEKKTYEKLHVDKQLLFYYYALSKLITDHDVLMSIFYIRDGGPFSPYFDDASLTKIEDIIRDTFNDVKQNIKPQLRDYLQQDRNCTWCTFYKTKFKGDDRNMCSRIRDDIEEFGIDPTTIKYKNKKHSFNSYQAPGT